MDVVEPLSSNGVPTDTEAGTPSPLPDERTADRPPRLLPPGDTGDLPLEGPHHRRVGMCRIYGGHERVVEGRGAALVLRETAAPKAGAAMRRKPSTLS